MNVKTSEETGRKYLQVWVRRFLLGAPTGIKAWARYLTPPNGFLYLEAVSHVEETEMAEFVEIIGFEGVK